MARGKHDSTVGIGLACDALDENLDKLDKKGVVFVGMNCKAPTQERSDWLITIKAIVDGESVIAFCSGFTLAQAIDRALRDFAGLKLKWKKDDYANH